MSIIPHLKNVSNNDRDICSINDIVSFIKNKKKYFQESLSQQRFGQVHDENIYINISDNN